MTGLQSLPNELLILILGASPTTRVLCDFAHVNKCMQTLWLEHSDRIIRDVYCSKIPHFQDAISATLAEARREALPNSGGIAPQAQPLHLHLAQILRNIDLASTICERSVEHFQKYDYLRPRTYTSLHSAYFLVRHVELAYSLPDTQPSLLSKLRGLSLSELETAQGVLHYINRWAPGTLRSEIGCIRTLETPSHILYEEQMTRPPLCWRHAELMFRAALTEKEEGVTGRMEKTWMTSPLEEEDMEYSSDSDWDLGSSSDLDA